jgi:drug/metabolite transporter (DMT)-like permease
VVNAIACTVIPFFLLFEGIRRCGAVRASLLTLCGPVVTAAGAWAILGETLTPLQIAGFAITIVSVASLSLPRELIMRAGGAVLAKCRRVPS